MDASATCDVVNRRKFQQQESAGDITSNVVNSLDGQNVQGGANLELIGGAMHHEIGHPEVLKGL